MQIDVQYIEVTMSFEHRTKMSSNKHNNESLQSTQDLFRGNLIPAKQANSSESHQVSPEECVKSDRPQHITHPSVAGSDLEPLFIPVVVTMSKGDHRVLACQWYSESQNKCEFGEIFNKLRYLNDYLRTTSPNGVIVASLDISCLATTLDQLHDHFLKCVEGAMESRQ